MDAADADLTRQAVEEIMREMQLCKEHEERPIQERKVNPLGRTNKHFLGRTLNAMVRHNKYKDEQTRRKCNKKLRELDEHKRKQCPRKRSNSFERSSPHERKRSQHLKVYVSDSSGSRESSSKHKKKRKKSKMKKKKKRHEKSRRDSSSSSSSSSDERTENQVLTNQYSYAATGEVDYSSFLMAPTLWDMHMQQFYQYKAFIALSAAAAQIATNNSVDIVELHSSSPSLSDIKLDDSTTSSEDDNCGMLTINVTDSDDAQTVKKRVPKKSSKSAVQKDDLNSSIEIIESDCISVKSSSSASSGLNAIDLTAD